MSPGAKVVLMQGKTGKPYPYQPGLAAWYDLSRADSVTYNATTGAASLVADLSGNSAVNCLVLDGNTNNYASAPDSVPVSITANIDLQADITAVSWAATGQVLTKRVASGSQCSYALSISSTGSGKLRFDFSPDGTTANEVTVFSDTATGFTALSRHWIRATRKSSDGTVKFYTSSEGVAWSQLGADVGGTAGAIFDSTANINVGANNNGGGVFNGIIHRAKIINGYDGAGSIVFDANFSTFAKGVSSGTESSVNAATVTIHTSGATGARISGARDLYQGTGANQPVYLPHNGLNYAQNFGVASNTLTTTTKTITGNVTFSFDLQLQDYTPAADKTLFDKLTGNNGIRVQLLTTGVVRLVVGDGSGATNVDSTVANTIVDAARGTLGIVWTDGVGASFTQNGSALGTAVAAVKTLTNSAQTVTVGPWTNRIYSITVTDGASTTYYSMNPPDATDGATSWTSAASSEVWTVNQVLPGAPALIVGRPGLLFNGSAHYMKTAPFALVQPEWVGFVGSQLSWTNNDAIFDGNATDSMEVYQAGLTPAIVLYAGQQAASNTGMTLGVNVVAQAVFNGASSSLRINNATATTGNPLSANGNGLTIGSVGGAGNYGNILLNELPLYSIAPTAVQINSLYKYARTKWALPTN